MLKTSGTVNELTTRAGNALRGLLEEVPAIKVEKIEYEAAADPRVDRGVDFLITVEVDGRPHVLVCEVKASGQPRYVRSALREMRSVLTGSQAKETAVFIAPYLSPEARELVRDAEAGFLDLEGNARLAFDSVFIERQVSTKPPVERRGLKSLFKPKSAQVLRLMFRDPRRAWRVAELAEAAGVSLGHVSNVRTGLLDREWAKISAEGLTLSEPDAVLDAWRDVYEAAAGKETRFYTTLHGRSFELEARKVLVGMEGHGKGAFASFSAAQWVAPYGRTSTHYFYADSPGLELLRGALRLEPTGKGENVFVTVLKDDGLFRDTVEPAHGAVCTSALQTYLDLWVSGERGRESADHLRREKLKWPQ